MKYLLLSISILLLFSFSIPTVYGVAGFEFIKKGAGGKVTSTTGGNVICDGGTGPVSHKPAGSSPSQSYFYPSGGGTSGSKTAPSNQKWVLALYNGFYSFGDCYTQDGPFRIPYPVYRVRIWGLSR